MRHIGCMNDIELVNQVKKGNANAYRYLVSKYQRLVFSIVNKITNQHMADAEDIAQEVFIKVYKSIKSYRNESKLSTWIASIAWKTSIDYIRKKTRDKIDYTDDIKLFEQVSDKNLFERVSQNELKEIVKQVLELLPGHYQAVLSLFYLEEFSINEIKEITNIPIGTIKSYLSRARGLFRTELEKLHGSEILDSLLNNN